jgi:hypothetical protein
MTAEKAFKILTKCEADLRALVASAASAGDYNEVMRITSLAKQISMMVKGWATSNPERRRGSESNNRRPSGAYPRFAKRGDQLVKFGWSKREKREYEHKAPREAVAGLARAAGAAGKDGRIFQVSELLGLQNQTDATEIPDYQVYLVVAWWRSADILDQHGRQGYSLIRADEFPQSVESAWAKLTVE